MFVENVVSICEEDPNDQPKPSSIFQRPNPAMILESLLCQLYIYIQYIKIPAHQDPETELKSHLVTDSKYLIVLEGILNGDQW